ncbi:mannose-1-phosphate guanylyltransferase/mannose-6-phosphate isomerase [Rhizobium sp. L43]|uniref:mannose-1-phosphate guanylyltransferase/mannose-6-phosphate isomerase n=1 Tax=Rhizobium sp. L43 TaxID=2035452 RepID=UPI000BEA9632|nr:mannose-1-phosphate guanylyltransferase/mannose-6-phosphate isomerase [Rhizobium sp. L43]PDS76365.1 mannose-1-phosphate guanylyltransferase/mannose-6-phosphate isomerase [Rhizobium sp. L43]
MSNELIVPVILAGGKGTRLWPLSRVARPKQFLALTGDLSLFQLTLKRLEDPNRYDKPIVVTNSEYRFLVAEQAQEVGIELTAIVLEPIARNTAPAIAAAALVAAKDGPRLVHVLPSDHNIGLDETYLKAIDSAAAAAKAGRLATFGIIPTSPATGFGYIEAGAKEQTGSFAVKRFVEKPNEEEAKGMIAKGGFYWNSGMFLFRSDVLIGECRELAPEVLSAAEACVEAAHIDLDFTRLGEPDFAKAPDISIDYAIFEKTALASVVPSPIQWSDLGAWDAVWKESPADDAGNVTRGPVNLYNSRNSFVLSEGAHVAVNGVEGAVVVVSEDAVYVGKLSDAQDVGQVVKDLMKSPKTAKLTEEHRTSYRPWGGYSSVLMGERFQVKRLFVKPGKRLSLQKHHHRSEHWIIVRGTAEVQIGDVVQMMRENQSVYIPQGDVHRLSNPGKILLELIEVQTGSYLGEDDIIRLEDTFGRT